MIHKGTETRMLASEFEPVRPEPTEGYQTVCDVIRWWGADNRESLGRDLASREFIKVGAAG